nr:antibiotic biosynthesis monooxygenase [Actinobacillus minor]
MSLSTQAAPIFNFFELGVQDKQKYDAIGEHNIHTSIQNEKGTLAMYSVKQKADPNMAYMVEIYANESAYKTHIASPQYQTFLAASPQILTDHKKRLALTPQFLGDKKIQQTAQIRTKLVKIEVNPQDNQQFAQIITAEMTQSLKVEDGVIAMYAATEQDQPNKWLFFEIYASDVAYEAHRKTPHFNDYLKQTEKMVVDKQMIEIEPTYLGNKGELSFIAKQP